jgi:hypothetical protein
VTFSVKNERLEEREEEEQFEKKGSEGRLGIFSLVRG